MAKKPFKPDADAVDETAEPKKSQELKKVHERALKRYKKCTDDACEKENRRNYCEDMKFTFSPGNQWTDSDKNARGKDRVMYEFNETRVNAMSVINHIRANRPAAKIRGVEETDKDLAEIRQGLYLNITNNSDFDSTKDYAAGHQVGGGFAAWRVDTEYSTDTAFDQDIVIRPIINPMCLHFDPSDKTELKTNAKYCFLHSKLSNEEYDAKYPKAERISFEPDEDYDPNDDEDSTWVAEYWEKVPIVKNVCLLSDGKTIDKAEVKQIPEGVAIVKERKINTFKVVQYIISGDAVLEGPNDWAGSMLPFIPVYGYYVVIEGKVFWCGLTRYQKDPQRALNWALTSVYETIGNTPQSKYWATAKQALGNTDQWAEATAKNFPALLYNADPEAPGPPQRMPGAEVPVALINAAGMARDALKASVGIFNASIGQTSNETSGRAIRARQDEGMVATFNFGDNMAKSERRTCEIVNDLMPHIYDTERNIRILGQDGAEKYLKINAIDPTTGQTINDMSAGKFDFVVTTGPSYATQRQEAAEFYQGLAQGNPQLMGAAGDLIVKAQDYPMADAIAERLKLILPPPIQAAISKDKPMPPEVQAAMMQVDQLQQQVQQQGQLVQQAAQEAQQEKSAADKAKSDVQVAIANLKVQESNLAVDVANFKVLVAQTEAKMAQSELQSGTEQNEKAAIEDRAVLSDQVNKALVDIQTQAAQMMDSYAKQLAQFVIAAADRPKPKPKTIRMRRENGGYTITSTEMDESGQPVEKTQRVARNGDGFQIN